MVSITWPSGRMTTMTFLFRKTTSPPFCHLVTKICWSLHNHSCPASLEETPASIATNIWPILRIHLNLKSCYLSPALSLQIENAAHRQILSWFVLFPMPPSPSQLQIPSTLTVWLSACLTLWIWPAAYWFCFGQAPVNKLVPATSLSWALQKYWVYDNDYEWKEASVVGQYVHLL